MGIVMPQSSIQLKDLHDFVKMTIEKHRDEPEYSRRFLEEVLQLFSEKECAAISKELHHELDELKKRSLKGGIGRNAMSIDDSDEEDSHLFRKEIIDFYIPKQLVNAIIANGGIPKDSIETQIGVGFIDIADYTFLAKFLSPKENQILLNGLYTAFANVLRKHGGYLNKTEGDSIMFHYGGLIDPKVKTMGQKDALVYISTELFYTCVEMQRVCFLFNQADVALLDSLPDDEEKQTVKAAFDIIRSMRNDVVMANAFNALFQIRIRIGANVGEVSIGNFGPPGSKHWDVIGIAVIDAKRMEATAPVGGLRISETFYNILLENGIVDQYYDEFKKEAVKVNGYFRNITQEELFYFGSVILKDKRNVTFRTYSVQVNPNLPEAIQEQIELLLQKGDIGAEKVVELLQYYRGNRHVIKAIEDLFQKKGIKIRKDVILSYLVPDKTRMLLKKMHGDKVRMARYMDTRYSLFDLLKALGNFQDKLKMPMRAQEPSVTYKNYSQYIKHQIGQVNDQYKRTIKNSIHNTYFFHVIFPLVFKNIKASILEYQYKLAHEEISEVAVIDEVDEIEEVGEMEEAESLG